MKRSNLQGQVVALETEKLHLENEIERLNKKIEQYENPEDMTLMFMWCDEKAKDEIKRLNKENEELKHKLKLINSYVYGCNIDSLGVDKE